MWKPTSRRNRFRTCCKSICKNYKYYQWLVKLFPGLSALTKRQKAKYLDLTLCQTKSIFLFFQTSFFFFFSFSLYFFLQGCSGVHVHHLSSPCHLFSLLSNITTICLFCSFYVPLSPTFHSFLNSFSFLTARGESWLFSSQARPFASRYELCFSTTLYLAVSRTWW